MGLLIGAAQMPEKNDIVHHARAAGHWHQSAAAPVHHGKTHTHAIRMRMRARMVR
ncbi:hypothetical protein [Luteimonas granuli]|uniref:hypothetical protein n=1 Tax=Luteimonas granuli TaxID=1176533 RepID=UPI00143DC2E6|nr:hypothetical protein [Luteimonas granuli]